MTADPRWTFLTNHALVLLAVANDPELTLRQIGDTVGITERAAHRIIGELADAGYLKVAKRGRRNVYRVTSGRKPLQPGDVDHVKVKDLLDLLME